MAVTLSRAEAPDVIGNLPDMYEPGPAPKVLIADKGYDRDAIRGDLEKRGVAPAIPHRRNRKIQVPVDVFISVLRNQIGRCFSRLKQNRRIATR